ncbi:hypothetical protein M408DRAFT_314992 [Serendipita vermifera MAFF 305830]|uniref:FAD-binding PCMH-type domain-containing protein n=1 Tax=Serendipita vermifera MAFF 305830 TaxID=933852 RepID=A0A0C3B2H3_SERVB|nr:hypothetical protein M408DRAFT_314992 [Serendipita vermifera MAFF 305830]
MFNTRSNEFKAALLAAGFTGDLVLPGDADYASSLVRFAKNSQKNAALVAFVKSAEDVSRIIKYVNDDTAANSTDKIPVVVRGGGHSTSGDSSTEGIVIDLSRHLNTVRVDPDAKLGYAGGGANWAAVDKEAIAHGLATVGGTVTIVTANGSILTANESSHPDLYWGIRGGGCNFGCVTEFVYKLHPQLNSVFAGPLVFPPPLLSAVTSALHEWRTNSSEDEGVIFGITTRGPMGGPALVVNVFYNGDEAEGRKRSAKFYELGPVVSGASMMPYENLNGIHNQAIPYGENCHLNGFTRGTRGVTPEMSETMFKHLMETASAPGPCATDTVAPKMTMLWEFYHLGKVASVAPDATAFRMRIRHSLSAILINWKPETPEASADALERVRTFKRVAEATVKETFEGGNKGENDTGYGNNETANSKTADGARALYAGNYPRLQEIKRTYDPHLMFKSWYPIRPLNAEAQSQKGLHCEVRIIHDRESLQLRLHLVG